MNPVKQIMAKAHCIRFPENAPLIKTLDTLAASGKHIFSNCVISFPALNLLYISSLVPCDVGSATFEEGAHPLSLTRKRAFWGLTHTINSER